MASTTSVFLWAVLVGCEGQKPPLGPPPTPPEETAETGTPTHSAPDDTSDTATPPTVPVYPMVRLLPEDLGDWAGRDLDVWDLDGDGRSEVLVSSDGSAHPNSGLGVGERTAGYLLRGAVRSGALLERASSVWTSAGHAIVFGHAPVLLPSVGQVGFGGKLDGLDSAFALYDVPEPGDGAVVSSSDAYAGYVDNHLQVEFGVPSFSSRCRGPTGPALCLSGTSHVDLTDFSGHVLVYELPIAGARPLLEHATWLKGDPGDFARTIDGDHDFDGDGRADLVVGAFGWHQDAGRLAVLHDLPAGEHRLWDVADATVTGEVAGEELGLGLATGDLNGDGYGDVLAGGPLGDGGAFVFLGPFTGDRGAAEADVTVSGGAVGEWLGYALAAGDLTGDGGADLAVGAPWSIYLDGAPPGAVLVYDDPVGALDVADATWRVVSGVSTPDAFGIAVGLGDVDGDGYGDLVVGAPRDPTVDTDAGSVTLLSGADLP